MRYVPSTRKRYVQFGFKGLTETPSSELTDPAYATQAQNFAFEDGCLTGGIGIDPALARNAQKSQLPDAPLPIRDIFFYKFTAKSGERDDRIVARLEDNTVWFVKLFAQNPQWTRVKSFSMIGKEVHAVNYNADGKDQLLFCSVEEPLFMLDDETPLFFDQAPQFSCFTMHSERLFGGVNGARIRLWFSDDFNPFNWQVSAEEAGYITFDDEYGDILQVMSFLGYLYIFREYGVFRLTAFGKQSEFVLKRVFVDTGRIVKNSIAFCGGKIMFMAGKNLYDFDGYSIRRVAKNLPEAKDVEGVKAACLDGYYYLSERLWDGEDQYAVIRYEFETEKISVMRGAHVRDLLTVRTGGSEDVFVALFDDATSKTLGAMSKSGRVMGAATHKFYEYAPSSLGTAKFKTLSCLDVVTDGDISLTVTADDMTHTFDVKGSQFQQRISVGAKGRRIGLTIRSDEACVCVPPVTAELEIHAN